MISHGYVDKLREYDDMMRVYFAMTAMTGTVWLSALTYRRLPTPQYHPDDCTVLMSSVNRSTELRLSTALSVLHSRLVSDFTSRWLAKSSFQLKYISLQISRYSSGVGLLVVSIWLQLFAHFIAPVVTTIILSSSKIHNGDILVPAYPYPPGKWPSEWREREWLYSRVREIGRPQVQSSNLSICQLAPMWTWALHLSRIG